MTKKAISAPKIGEGLMSKRTIIDLIFLLFSIGTLSADAGIYVTFRETSGYSYSGIREFRYRVWAEGSGTNLRYLMATCDPEAVPKGCDDSKYAITLTPEELDKYLLTHTDKFTGNEIKYWGNHQVLSHPKNEKLLEAKLEKFNGELIDGKDQYASLSVKDLAELNRLAKRIESLETAIAETERRLEVSRQGIKNYNTMKILLENQIMDSSNLTEYKALFGGERNNLGEFLYRAFLDYAFDLYRNRNLVSGPYLRLIENAKKFEVNTSIGTFTLLAQFPDVLLKDNGAENRGQYSENFIFAHPEYNIDRHYHRAILNPFYDCKILGFDWHYAIHSLIEKVRNQLLKSNLSPILRKNWVITPPELDASLSRHSITADFYDINPVLYFNRSFTNYNSKAEARGGAIRLCVKPAR